MILKGFYVNVFIRVAVLVISAVIMGIILSHLEHGYYYTLSGMLILILVQTMLLLNEVNRTNQDLEKFFSSIHDHDSSIRFSTNMDDSSFINLRKKLNDFNSALQQVKMENERNRQFLQSLVDHVDVGLVSFNSNGDIEICNKAAKRYLNINQDGRLTTLKENNEDISEILAEIKPGQDVLHKMKNGTQQKSLLIRETEVKFEGQVVRLISFADITSELDTKELESWQRLIRVLTHEIMNSISPVTSLTSVISGYFKNKENGNPLSSTMINDHIISKTLDGLDTIEETGKGLLDFVDKYRSLTSLPKPKSVKFSINNVFSQCRLLMEAGMPDNIIITFESHPHDLELTADFGQVEQILINLIKNAAEAIGSKEKGVIQLRAMREADWILIQIQDNGPGIDDASLKDIFVPFYTTKKKGSGIGLSISRQIMRNHNGTLSVESDTSVGAVFTLKFPLINFLP